MTSLDAAHPRSRGENMVSLVSGRAFSGSSPLTRGKRFSVGAGLRIVRLIPAHAGKTTRRSSPGPPEAAHPRSRGENSTPAFSRACIAGSSPLTRGKPGHASHDHGFSGLIPAHAGKTLVSEATPEDSGAHPRSRGENTSRAILNPALAGSSPLTRGKQQGDYRPMLELRLIPAHAGKTSPGRRSRPCCRAHPRSRGENFSRPKVTPLLPGSSPLTRGKRVLTPRPAALARLIPAHAGKTSTVYKDGEAVGAHPRSRGENSPHCRTAVARGGSSPLTRGKL